jgi:hypothetical protein
MATHEARFHEAMLHIYKTALAETGYNATRFLRMVSENGGLQAARTLLHAATVSDGYAALWERGRLDLTVEALIVSPDWSPLFTPSELEIARRRLKEYGFNLARLYRCGHVLPIAISRQDSAVAKMLRKHGGTSRT